MEQNREKDWEYMKKNQKTEWRHLMVMPFGKWQVICLICLVLLSLQTFAYGQGGLNIQLKEATFKEVLNKIQQMTDFNFIYSDIDIASMGRRTIICENAKVEDVLKDLFEGTALSFSVVDRTIIIKKTNSKSLPLGEEQIVVKGVVMDSKKQPLPGVTVRIKDSNYGVSTDMDGSFTLNMAGQKSMVLVFSFVGMKNKEVKITKSDFLKITLEDDIQELQETVVTGIFARKKEGFTGSAVSVKGEDLKKFSTTSVIKALSAVDPSFRIMDNLAAGSDPNRLPDLRMRGQATLPGGGGGESDLVSLKGEYSTYPNQPLLMLDGFEISLQTMVDLDPDRVESITLLKDAAATAIYGSKAANGVIVIETKMPAEGALVVSYGGNVRMEMPDLSAYNLMNATEKLQAEKLAGFYPEDGDIKYVHAYQEYLREAKRGVNTYWLSQPLRTAVQHRHALTVEGGDKALRYKLYAGINLTPGVMKESDRRTLTGALDLSYRFKNLRLKNSVTVEDAVGNNSPYGSFRDYAELNPYLRKYGPDGKILKDLQRSGYNVLGTVVANPMYNATFNSKNRNSLFTVRNLFKVEYDPIESLRLQLDFSLSKGNGKTEVFKPAQHTDYSTVTDPELRGSYSLTQSESFAYDLGLQLSYNKTFGGVHFVTSNFRMTLQSSTSNSYGATVTGFPNDKMDNILFGRKYNEKVRGSEGTSRSVGWVGTFGYSYDYRYSFDFNIRVDGSSQFGSENRFAPFWSAGFRWNAKKEGFLESFKALSDLVVRTSYGVTGTQGFAPYQSQQMYSYNNLLKPYFASDGTGCALVGLGNSELKWQRTNQTNLALELGFLDNRITGRVEYYWKTTINSLTDISLAPSIGFSTVPENMGTIKNEGLELMLGFIPWRNIEKNASVAININGSHNKDKIVKISDALRTMNEQNANKTKDAPLPRYEEGRSQTEIWVVKSLGIDPATGNEVFVRRLSGEMTGIWSAADLMPMGNTEPVMEGYINGSFNYKGWGVNLSFNYRFGGDVYNQTLLDRVENADLRYNADKRVLYSRWTKPGDVAKFKRLTNSESGGSTQASSRFIMKEQMLRFSSLALSYRMDNSNAEWIKRLSISSLTLGLTFEELFHLSTVKQERGLDYPFARQCALSLNVTF